MRAPGQGCRPSFGLSVGRLIGGSARPIGCMPTAGWEHSAAPGRSGRLHAWRFVAPGWAPMRKEDEELAAAAPCGEAGHLCSRAAPSPVAAVAAAARSPSSGSSTRTTRRLGASGAAEPLGLDGRELVPCSSSDKRSSSGDQGTNESGAAWAGTAQSREQPPPNETPPTCGRLWRAPLPSATASVTAATIATMQAAPAVSAAVELDQPLLAPPVGSASSGGGRSFVIRRTSGATAWLLPSANRGAPQGGRGTGSKG